MCIYMFTSNYTRVLFILLSIDQSQFRNIPKSIQKACIFIQIRIQIYKFPEAKKNETQIWLAKEGFGPPPPSFFPISDRRAVFLRALWKRHDILRSQQRSNDKKIYSHRKQFNGPSSLSMHGLARGRSPSHRRKTPSNIIYTQQPPPPPPHCSW